MYITSYFLIIFINNFLLGIQLEKKNGDFIALKVLSQTTRRLELLNLYKHRFIALAKIQFETYTIYIDCIQLV